MPLIPPNAQKPERPAKGPSKFFTEYYSSVIFVLIAAFMAGAFFLLQPLIVGIKETNAATQSELRHAEALRNYLSSLNQSVAAAQAIPSDMLDRVNEALPDDAGTPSLLMQFSNAAARNNVQIGSIGFATEQRTTTPGRVATSTQNILPVTIDISLKGRNYVDVKRFLADVETSLRLMDVTSLSAAPSGKGLSSYTIQIRSYVFKPVQTTARP